MTEILQSKVQWSRYEPPDYHATFLRLKYLVLGRSKNERLLFPYTTLHVWFIWQRFHHLQPTFHCIYNQINIHLYYVLPQSEFLCFVRIRDETATISLCNINWHFYTTEISASKAHCSLYVPADYHSTFIRSSHWFPLLISGGS